MKRLSWTMSLFSEEKLAAKFKNLNETQASIVGLSQWTLFHFRHANKIAATWAKSLASATNEKKLPLIYLANDVIQQARARKKLEFIQEFSKVFPKTLPLAYKSVDPKIRNKIKRSINVWKERKILDESLVRGLLKDFSAIDSGKQKAKSELVPARSSTGETIAKDLRAISDSYIALRKTEASVESNVQKFNKVYLELFLEDSNLQSPNIFLNQIQELLQVYNKVKVGHEVALSSHKTVIENLENLVSLEKKKLQLDFEQFGKEHSFETKLAKIETTKKDLEEMILEDVNGVDEGDMTNKKIVHSPVMESGEDDAEDEVPQYVQLSDEEEEKVEEREPKRQKIQEASANSTAVLDASALLAQLKSLPN